MYHCVLACTTCIDICMYVCMYCKKWSALIGICMFLYVLYIWYVLYVLTGIGLYWPGKVFHLCLRQLECRCRGLSHGKPEPGPVTVSASGHRKGSRDRYQQNILLQQATGRMAVIEQAGVAGRAQRQESEELTNHMQIGVPTAGRMVTGKSANQQRSANKQSASRAGSAWRTGSIVERIAPRSALGSYWSVGDRGPSYTRDEQR